MPTIFRTTRRGFVSLFGSIFTAPEIQSACGATLQIELPDGALPETVKAVKDGRSFELHRCDQRRYIPASVAREMIARREAGRAARLGMQSRRSLSLKTLP